MIKLLTEMTENELLALGFRQYNCDEDFLLIPAKLYNQIPDGTELIGIHGDTKIKGRDRVNMETRGGILAYGIRPVDAS